MANNVILYQRPNRSFELEINGLMAKTDFTSSGFPSVVTEASSYLLSADGQARLSGSYDSTAGDTIINYATSDPSPSDFDGTFSYRIVTVKQTN